MNEKLIENFERSLKGDANAELRHMVWTLAEQIKCLVFLLNAEMLSGSSDVVESSAELANAAIEYLEETQ